MNSKANQVPWNLRRIVKGDGAATAWLFDTFGDRLYRRLRSRYQYPGGIDAEDLLQDSFVFYLQKGAKVLRDFIERVPEHAQTPERLERHLWDLACGLAANRRRSLKRKKDEPLPDDQWLEETKAGPAEEVMSRQEMQLLDECLEGAGSKVYLYYKLRYWDGHAPAEIAKITGWSMKSTYRQRQKLNDALAECAGKLGMTRYLAS